MLLDTDPVWTERLLTGKLMRMGFAESRLKTIASSAATLAGAAVITAVAHAARATLSDFNYNIFPAWQRPFVDGASYGATTLALAGVVLLLMLPAAGHFRRIRLVTTGLLALAVSINLVLGAGFVVARSMFSPNEELGRWDPDVAGFLASQFPTWAVTVVTAVILFNWRRESPKALSDGSHTTDSSFKD